MKNSLGGCLLRDVVLKFVLTSMCVNMNMNMNMNVLGFEEDRCGMFEDTKFNVQRM